MRRLLVTGGAGFIGANFVRYWLSARPSEHVIVFDALTYAGNRANLAGLEATGRFELVVGDICDERLVTELLEQKRIDTIVHFAAESHVDRSIVGPDEFVRTNVVGTHTLLKVARRFWQVDGNWRAGVRFHHVSTDEVYGSLRTGDPAFTELTPYAPNSPYAASKAGSDHLVRAYHHTYGMPVTTSNCSNNYGPYQFPEKLIPLMIFNALDGKPLPVYGKGENVRDWLYVEDHSRAIELVLDRGRLGETYNVGGRNERRNIDLVRGLCRLIDQRMASSVELRARFPRSPAAQGVSCESLVTFVQDRLGHDWRYAIDGGKLETELGWRAGIAVEAGMELTLDWYLANERWWRGIQSGAYRDSLR